MFYDVVFAPDAPLDEAALIGRSNSEGELTTLAKMRNPLVGVEMHKRLVQRYRQLPSMFVQLPIDKIIHPGQCNERSIRTKCLKNDPELESTTAEGTQLVSKLDRRPTTQSLQRASRGRLNPFLSTYVSRLIL